MDKKSYICPCCKEKQYTVMQWQTVSVGYTFNLADNQFNAGEERSDSADHEDFGCPNCGEELEQDLIDKLKLWERI